MSQPPFQNQPDWAADEELLYLTCREAIVRFAVENPNETCSFLGFDSEPCYGYVIIGFDTRENEIEECQRRQQYEVENRVKQFANENAWQTADYFVGKRQIYTHCRSTGSFAFDQYETIEFSSWEEFSNSYADDLPEECSPEYEEAETKAMDLYGKYLEGNVILIFWKVIERLIAAGDLEKLNLASPFRLGYNFHDQDVITVVRILNWE